MDTRVLESDAPAPSSLNLMTLGVLIAGVFSPSRRPSLMEDTMWIQVYQNGHWVRAWLDDFTGDFCFARVSRDGPLLTFLSGEWGLLW